MFIGIGWNLVVNIIFGILNGEWLGQGGTSDQQTPQTPLRPFVPDERPPTTPRAPTYIPDGGDSVRINTNPPPSGPSYSPPSPISTTATDPIEPTDASLPPLWLWGPFWTVLEGLQQIRRWLFDDQRIVPGVGESPAAQFGFGKLLCGNMGMESLTRTEWTYIVSLEEQQQHHQESYEGYQHWLANQVAGVPLPDNYQGNFYDQGAILWPFDQRDFSSGLTLLYGSRFLGDIFANFWTRSLNYDAATIRGTVYFDIEIEQLPAPWTRMYIEGNPEESDNSLATEGLMTEIAQLLQAYRATFLPEDAALPPPPTLKMEGSSFGSAGKNLDKILAVKDFPFKVPISLLLEPEDIAGLEDPEEAYEKIESIPQLILWLTKALDELIGKFPIKLEIAESDFVDLSDEYEAWQGADQSPNENVPFYLQNDRLVSYRRQGEKIVKTVKIPNLAEGIAELLGSSLVADQNQSLGLELATRALLEIGSAKNLSIQIHALAEAIADYLGFESKDKLIDVEYTYNPILSPEQAEGSYKRLLKPSTVQTSILEFVGKNGMEKTIATIQEIHGIIKAAHTEGIGKTDGQLKRRLLDYAAELGIFPTPPPTPPGQDSPQDEFDQLLERIEWGFIDQPGVDPNHKPYGRDYGKRPKIRRLTNSNEGQQQ